MRAVLLLAVSATLLIAQQKPAAPAPPPPTDPPSFLDAGKAAYMKGNYEAAGAAFLSAWNMLEAKAEDGANPLWYDALKALIGVRAATGDFQGACDYLDMAIKWREVNLGENDPKAWEDRAALVNLLRGAKQYDRALMTLNRVYSHHAQTIGPITQQVADDFSLMAQIYMENKLPEPAETRLNMAISMREKLTSPLDPCLLNDMERLGGLQTMQREYDRASVSYRRALIIRETLYGKESAELLTALDGLAYALFGEKKYDEAEPLYKRLVAQWKSAVTEEHPMMAVAYTKLAVFYAAQKKHTEAAEAYARSAAVRTKFLAQGLSEAAAQEMLQGHATEALAMYKRAAAAMDTPDPLYEEARKENAGILELLEPAQPKPAPKPATKPAPKAAPKLAEKKADARH